MMSRSVVMAALLAATSVLAQSHTTGVEEPSAVPKLGAPVVQGCYSSAGKLKLDSTPDFNSKSKCALEICKAKGKSVAGTMGGDQCFCGDEYPPKAALAKDSDCNVGCSGFDQQACESISWLLSPALEHLNS